MGHDITPLAAAITQILDHLDDFLSKPRLTKISQVQNPSGSLSIDRSPILNSVAAGNFVAVENCTALLHEELKHAISASGVSKCEINGSIREGAPILMEPTRRGEIISYDGCFHHWLAQL